MLTIADGFYFGVGFVAVAFIYSLVLLAIGAITGLAASR